MSLTVQPGWTLAAAAVQLGVTRVRVHQLVKAGKLRSIRLLGRTYVDAEGLREYIAKQQEQKRGKEVSSATN